VSNQPGRLRDLRPRRILAFKDTGKQAQTRAMQAHPLGVQLGARLTRSAPLGMKEDVQLKDGLALEHVLDGTRQFVCEDGQCFSFVMLFLQAGQILLPRCVIA
jgi:hypothetical protein